MEIKLNLTVDEVNIILNALVCRPYAEVAELIGKIQSEGNKQLQEHKAVAT
jgi:hypothetical protein